MSCKNDWRKLDWERWINDNDEYEKDRWKWFKDEYERNYGILFDKDPRKDHADRHIDWDKMEWHMFSQDDEYYYGYRGRDGAHDKDGSPAETSWFPDLDKVDQAMRDFMKAKQGEIAAREAAGKGTVSGYVDAPSGHSYGEAWHGDSNAFGPDICQYLGKCDQAFVLMNYDGVSWNVRTAYPLRKK